MDKMKIFAAHYESPCNIFKGVLHIEAKDHKEAMLKFFNWIQTKEVWGHLWRISVELKEVEKMEKI